MSPLAHIRQVAACTLLAGHGSLALAAGSTGQPAPVSEPTQVTQSAQIQPAQATESGQAARSTQATGPGQSTAHSMPSSQPIRLAPNGTAQVARSALLSVEGTATADHLRLSIRRVGDRGLEERDEVTVTIDGKSEPVTHDKGGIYEVPIDDLRADRPGDPPKDLEIIVAHDGIREILSGKVAVAEAASGGSLLGDHKQIAWWILNIVIVLVAAIALSRRKG
jgi:hypothetical protein